MAQPARDSFKFDVCSLMLVLYFGTLVTSEGERQKPSSHFFFHLQYWDGFRGCLVYMLLLFPLSFISYNDIKSPGKTASRIANVPRPPSAVEQSHGRAEAKLSHIQGSRTATARSLALRRKRQEHADRASRSRPWSKPRRSARSSLREGHMRCSVPRGCPRKEQAAA